MSYLPGILTAYAVPLLGVLSPGPAVGMLLGIAQTEGRRAALITCAGIGTGGMTLNLLTMAGIGLILSQTVWAMAVLKVFGVGYLLWLAWGAFRRAAHPPRVTLHAASRRTAWQRLLQGYLLQVSHPKAVAFWLAIASLGAVDGAPLPIVLGFVAGAWVLGAGGHAAWALVLSSHPVRLAYHAARRWIEGTLGLFFAFAAYKLARAEV